MRKIIPALALAAATAVATPALAQDYQAQTYAPLATGAVVGTTVGVGLYNGWWGHGAFVSALPATTLGAVAVGGVAGIGTIALLDAFTQHCRGFGIFVTPREQCVNGEWVGDRPVVVQRHRGRVSMR